MEIKKVSVDRPRSRRTRLVAAALALGLLGWSGICFYLGTRAKEPLANYLGSLGSTPYQGSLTGRLKRDFKTFLDNYSNTAPAASPVETIVLDIKHKHMVKLNGKRDQALRDRLLQTGPNDFVPAKVRHGGRQVSVKVRLKGDMLDHLLGKKWSFRVKVGGDDHVLGKRVFSLQHPRTRGYVSDWLFQKHLIAEGVLGVSHRFVELVINGESKGLMDMEEHFSKELLESQGRREGVIFRFDEAPMWSFIQLNGGLHVLNEIRTPPPNKYPRLIPFQNKKVEATELFRQQKRAGVALMRGYLEGRLAASEVFDVGTWSRFLAVAEVRDMWHALGWANLRFYFNSVTAKLEPVGFDSYAFDKPKDHSRILSIPDRAAFILRMLEDPKLRGAFVKELHRIATEVAKDSFLQEDIRLERELRGILTAEFPLLEKFDVTALKRRSTELAKVSVSNYKWLRRSGIRYSDIVQASLVGVDEGGGKRLEMTNLIDEVVEVLGLDLRPARGVTPPTLPAELREFPTPIVLEPSPVGGPAVVHVLDVELPDGPANGVEVILRARIPGREETYSMTVVPSPPAATSAVIPRDDVANILDGHSFLTWNEESGEFKAKQGEWIIDSSINLPDGAGLRVPAGTTLRFHRGAALIARGPLTFTGSKESPIILDAVAESGDEASGWPGVIVLEASTPSSWKHVTVRRTRGITRPGWAPTGGVTFYRSMASFSDCRFEKNSAEDALNVISSTCDLTNVDFRDCDSDALDADFCHVTIESGSYARIGGDALDFSGSEVTARGVVVNDTSDKAISVGEATNLSAKNFTIENVQIGLASKDGSNATLTDSTMTKVQRVAVIVYTKKPEYGPSRAEVKNIELTDAKEAHVAQTGSHLVVDGQRIAERPVDVDAMYGKSK